MVLRRIIQTFLEWLKLLGLHCNSSHLFMKMKNIAEMFIFIPHTLESVLCPYGEVLYDAI